MAEANVETEGTSGVGIPRPACYEKETRSLIPADSRHDPAAQHVTDAGVDFAGTFAVTSVNIA